MATQSRTFSFVISGSSDQAVEALRRLADAGKNTGGELGKAGRQLERALGNGTQAEQTGRAFADRFGVGLDRQLRSTASDAVSSFAPEFVSGLTSELGGAEAALSKVSTGALAAAAAVAAVAAAWVKFGQAGVATYTDLVGQARTLTQLTGLSAEETIPLVDVFQRFGLSAKDVSQVLVQLSSQLQGDTLKKMQALGVEVQKNADGTTNLAATMFEVLDAARQLPDLQRNQLLQNAFGEDDAVKMLPLLKLTREEMAKLLAEAQKGGWKDFDALARWEQQTAELAQSWRQIKFEAGRTILPALTSILHAVDAIGESKGFKVFASAVGVVMSPVTRAIGALGDASKSIDVVGSVSNMAADGLRNLSIETDKTVRSGRDLAAAYANAADKLSASSAAFKAFTADERASISTATGLQNAWKALADAEQARTKAAKSASDAAGNLARAQAEASESVSDAEADAAERIANAQDRVTEARERATRAAEDSTRRLRDARQAELDAIVRSAGVDNPFEATRMREEAAQDLADAEVDAARAQEDARKGVADAEAALRKEQVDSAKRVADAQAQAADRIEQAQRAVAEAVEASTGAATDYSGALQDVVDKTFDAASWARQHGATQAEVQGIIDASRGKVEGFATAMGLSAEATAALIAQLDLIPSQVELNFVARLNLDEFRAKLAEASQAFGDAASAAAVASGAALGDVGGATPTPVFTQQQAGVNVTIQAGTLVHERELPALIETLKRRGFM